MRGNYRVIDTERHVVEPRDIWDRWLDPAFRDQAPRWINGSRVATVVGGKPMIQGGDDVIASIEPAESCSDAMEADFSAQSNLADMDREGIDVALLYPTAGLYVIWGDHVEADLSVAICRAYNDWLADYCRIAPDRLKGIAMLPLQDVDAAIAEMRRAKSELHHIGAFVRPNPVRKRQLNDQAYWPLWQAAAELGMPICVHSSPGSVLPEIGVRDITGLEWPEGVQRFEGPFARNAISYPLEVMGAVISMAGEEPMEEYPDLKVLFSSGGNGWLQFWIERMDDEWFHRGNDAVTKLRPGHYFERQGLVAGYGHERIWPFLTEEFGDCLAWGSGYPHPTLTGFPDELDPLVDNERLGEEEKRRFYGTTRLGCSGSAEELKALSRARRAVDVHSPFVHPAP